MKQAIEAKRITIMPEYRESERLRSKARHDEAQALKKARHEERKQWQSVVADKDTIISKHRARTGEIGK